MLLPAVITFSLFILNYISQIGIEIYDTVTHEQVLHNEAKYDIELYNCIKDFSERIHGETGVFIRDFNLHFNWLNFRSKENKVSSYIEEGRIVGESGTSSIDFTDMEHEIPGLYFAYPLSNTHICIFNTQNIGGISGVLSDIRYDNDSVNAHRYGVFSVELMLLDSGSDDSVSGTILRHILVDFVIENED